RELLLRRRATDAANHLGLSPSAISHALTRLRDLFGDPLFIRRSHGLEPTQRALDLGPQVDAVIAALGRAVAGDPAFDPARSTRRFRVGCPTQFATLFGDRIVEAFRQHAPRVSVSIRPAYLERALRAVRRGQADVAVGVFDRIPHGLAAHHLYDDEYCLIARKDHPSVHGKVDGRTYARIGHVFVGNPDGFLADETPLDPDTMEVTYGALPGPDRVSTQAYVPEWETAMLIVCGSDVLAECPRRLATRFAARLGLQVLDPPFSPFRFTVQAVRRADVADAGLDWLLARLHEALEP
ncbi:MAG TPA: LysR family transcriptional regulator, partial [Caulobacteraceae bacterium]|nr:LysR family transcriptional regulator [Caulobacteraceae bacterium]